MSAPQHLSAPSGDAALQQRLASLPTDKRALLLDWMDQLENRTRTYPLSPKQHGMWFLHRLVGETPLYNVPWFNRVRGDLDAGALRRALHAVVARHEALRTRFVTEGGTAVQAVEEHLDPDWHESDLSALPDPDVEPALARVLSDLASRPFDLERGPLLRCQVARLPRRRHVVAFNVHHIVFDAWSMRLFSDELWALYAAFREGRPSPLTLLPPQYGACAERDAAALEDGTLERQMAYWAERMAGAPAVLDLPSDRPRPAVGDHRGATLSLPVASEAVRGLRELGAREQATLFQALLAVFKVLLYRSTGVTDLSVGVPFSGRTDADSQEAIGLFINTLPVRTQLDGDRSYRELLRLVRRSALGALMHQDVPTDALVSRLAVDRNLSHNPLFQTLFSIEEGPPRGELPGLELEGVEEVATGTAKLDLSWAVEVAGEHSELRIEYSTALFDRATVAQFAKLYRTLLVTVQRHPDTPISRLPLMGERDRAAVAALNDRAAPPDSDDLAHEAVAAQCERTPEAAAVRCAGRTMTYAELRERTRALARHLRALGVGPEEPVGICVRRSPELVVAALAVLEAGGAFVPLEASFPDERLAMLVEDTGMRVLLSEPGLIDRLDGLVGQVVDLTCLPAGTPPTGVPGAGRGATPGDLAYIMFTSGSTGRPKGVLVTHGALRNFLSYVRREPGLDPGDVMLAVSTAIFDISLYELIAPLTLGATVVLATEDEARDGRALRGLVEQAGVTVVDATPATWRMLIEAGWEGSPQLRAISTGEALPGDLATQLLDRAGDVFNLYGPTESTVWASCWRVSPDAPRILIGRPTENTTLWVLDEHYQQVPVGIPGELFIGGEGLARGYLNRPGLTAERFVPDLAGATPGSYLYRTGDRVRLTAGGELDYLGRLDHQLKLRGYRIEPGEVEAVLLERDEVAQAVVAVRGGTGQEQLVAYVVPEPGATCDPAELRERAGQVLPPYMVPQAVVVLDGMPLSPNGKVDRKALPDPGDERQSATAYVAPRTDLERRLVDAWQRVLGVERVGVRDDFFDLGGHSLDVLRLTAELEQSLGHALTPSDMFQYPTVALLAEQLGSQAGPAATGPVTPIRAGGEAPPLVLVHPIGGTVWCYAGLAGQLGDERAVYGITARGVESAEPPRERLEDMARAYLDALPGAGVEPPYVLGGWSMGGMVAFEMARQLQEAGRGVPDVLMIDTASPEVTSALDPDDATVLAAFARDLGANTGLDLGIDAAALRPLDAAGREGLLLDRARAHGLVGDEGERAQLVRAAATFASNTRATFAYAPRGPLRGRVVLLRVSDGQVIDGRRSTDGWAPLVDGRLVVQKIPGDHYSCMRDPQVSATALAVTDMLTLPAASAREVSLDGARRACAS